MRVFHLYHNHAFNRAIHKDFWRFEFSVWLHTIAVSLVSIFVPIFLLELGYSLTAVIGYYILMNVIDVPLNFLAERVVARTGAKRAIIIATLAAILWFLILRGAEMTGAGWITLLVLALLDAVYDAFYYVGHIYLFLRSSKEHTGRETGMLYSARILGSMCGPMIGAALFAFGARGTLLSIAIAFFAASLIPLFHLRHAEDRPPAPRSATLKILADSQDWENFASLFVRAVHVAAENTLWPIFVYLTFAGAGRSVAAVAVIVSLSQVAFAYFAGSIRRTSRPLALLAGGGLVGAIWLLRFLIADETFYYVSVLFLGFASLFISIPVDSGIFERGRRGDSLRYSTLRNAVYMRGQLLFYLIIFLLSKIFPQSFLVPAVAGFTLAVLAAAALTRQRVSSA